LNKSKLIKSDFRNKYLVNSYIILVIGLHIGYYVLYNSIFINHSLLNYYMNNKVDKSVM